MAVIEGHVKQALQTIHPEPYVHPQLSLETLRAGQGLYLRMHEEMGESIEEAARFMQPDAIARCLGIAPSAAGAVYQKSGWLRGAFIKEIDQSEDMMTVRVEEDVLKRHIRRDLPALKQLLGSDYLLLIMQYAKTRGEKPVDVWIWDLNTRDLLLSQRIKANGLIIPVSINKGANPQGLKPTRGGAAADCSIAASLRDAINQTAETSNAE